MMKKIAYIFILFLIVPFISLAQTETDKKDENKEVYNLERDVHVKYQPKVTDALKMAVVPVNEKFSSEPPPVSYNIKTKLHPTERIVSKIPAISLKSPKRERLSHMYVKAGAGNYANVLADINYNSLASRDMIFAIQARHHSGKSSLINSNSSEELLNIYAKKMFRGKAISGKVYTSNNALHFFGYNQDSLSFEKDSIKQNYFNIGFLANFDNELDTRAKYKYDLQTGFDYLRDKFNAHEIGASFNGGLEQHFREHPIHVGAKYQFYNINQESRAYNRNILNIIAQFDYIRDNFRGRAGFDVATENDSNNSQFHFYPTINVEGDLFDNNLTLYAGMTGGLLPNTYKSIIEDNPFVQADITLQNTNNKIELYTGVKGSVGSKFNYLFKFSYHNVENFMTFVNDTTETKRFITTYDSGNASIIRLKTELHTKPMKNLDLFLKVNYNAYDLSTELHAWHMPDYDITLTGKYNIDEKVYFTLDFFNIGERKAKTFDLTGNTKVIDLPSIYDLNVGVTYKFSDQFGVFFNFNNILSNKYSYWNQYQLRGFHFLGGIKANLF